MEKTEDKVYFFDEFEVNPKKRLLLKSGEAVAINPKTFDLLGALVNRRGEVVSKNDLLDAVWENQFVEEKNLSVHVAALRKALGETKNENRFIATVPGTGYTFVAELYDHPDHGILVENQRFQRVVIEEEITIHPDSGVPSQNESLPARRFPTFIRDRPYLAAGIAVIALSAFAGFIWQKRESNFSGTTPFAHSAITRLTTTGKVLIATLSPDGELHFIETLEGKLLICSNSLL